MPHQYSNENARLSDLWILIQAGNSTTVSAICFLLSDLAKNRDIQTKLASILSEFMPKKPNLTLVRLGFFGINSDRIDANFVFIIDNDDDYKEDNELLSKIANCEYLNHCLKESMRLWPTAGGSIRDVEHISKRFNNTYTTFCHLSC